MPPRLGLPGVQSRTSASRLFIKTLFLCRESTTEGTSGRVRFPQEIPCCFKSLGDPAVRRLLAWLGVGRGIRGGELDIMKHGNTQLFLDSLPLSCHGNPLIFLHTCRPGQTEPIRGAATSGGTKQRNNFGLHCERHGSGAQTAASISLQGERGKERRRDEMIRSTAVGKIKQ